MNAARHYTPSHPSRSHGEEIAAALFAAAIERAKCAPVNTLRLPDGRALDSGAATLLACPR